MLNGSLGRIKGLLAEEVRIIDRINKNIEWYKTSVKAEKTKCTVAQIHLLEHFEVKNELESILILHKRQDDKKDG